MMNIAYTLHPHATNARRGFAILFSTSFDMLNQDEGVVALLDVRTSSEPLDDTQSLC